MKKRYIEHDRASPTAEDLPRVIESLTASLEDGLVRIRRHTEIHHSMRHATVYTGSTGIKMMEHHLQVTLPRALRAESIPKINDFHPDVLDGSHCGYLATSVGPATVVIIRSMRNPHHLNYSLFRKAFMHVTQAVSLASEMQPNSDDGCEVMYGRAGLLYALLLIRKAILAMDEALPLMQQILDLTSNTTLAKLVDVIVNRGRYGASIYSGSGSTTSPPLMWRWHGKRYLGAAHGLAGILHMLMLCPTDVTSTRTKKEIADTALWLASIQDEEGNWPSKISTSEGKNELVQWCHGAPGVIVMLSALWKKRRASLDANQQELVTGALRKGAELTYTRGFLRKGVGLCHGIGGSIYALLAVSDVLDEHDNLLRAAHLAQLAIPYRKLTSQGRLSLPDRPLSLYEGVAGMCCALSELIERLKSVNSGKKSKHQGLPAFSDLDIM